RLLLGRHLAQCRRIESEALPDLLLGERARLFARERRTRPLLWQRVAHLPQRSVAGHGDTPLLGAVGDIAAVEARIAHFPQRRRKPVADQFFIRIAPRFAPDELVPLRRPRVIADEA